MKKYKKIKKALYNNLCYDSDFIGLYFNNNGLYFYTHKKGCVFTKAQYNNFFDFLLKDVINDYIDNYNFLLDKEYLDISYFKINYHKKNLIINIDDLYSLFKDNLSDLNYLNILKQQFLTK